MPRVILAGDNLVPGSTLTGATGLDDLKNYRLDKVWSQSAADTVQIALAAASDVDTIAVGGVSEGSTITATATGLDQDLGATGTAWNPPSGHLHILALDTAINISSINLAFTANPQAAWIYIGERIRTRAGITDSFRHEIQPGPGNRRTRTLSVEWPVLSKTEASDLRAMALRHGMETPVLIVPRDEDESLWAEEAMLGRIQGAPVFSPWLEAGRNRRMGAAMTFVEVTA